MKLCIVLYRTVETNKVFRNLVQFSITIFGVNIFNLKIFHFLATHFLRECYINHSRHNNNNKMGFYTINRTDRDLRLVSEILKGEKKKKYKYVIFPLIFFSLV